jgi:hypothetical protein
MLRCAPILAAALSFVVAATATAQPLRSFPATALRGELVVTTPPEAQLNRQPARRSHPRHR